MLGSVRSSPVTSIVNESGQDDSIQVAQAASGDGGASPEHVLEKSKRGNPFRFQDCNAVTHLD